MTLVSEIKNYKAFCIKRYHQMIINDDGTECKSKNIEGLFENINYKKKELINLCGYRQPA